MADEKTFKRIINFHLTTSTTITTMMMMMMAQCGGDEVDPSINIPLKFSFSLQFYSFKLSFFQQILQKFIPNLTNLTLKIPFFIT